MMPQFTHQDQAVLSYLRTLEKATVKEIILAMESFEGFTDVGASVRRLIEQQLVQVNLDWTISVTSHRK